MSVKQPENFVPGDIIENVSTTPYSGSTILQTKSTGDTLTTVWFRNGEIVEFYNGIQHEMRE
jgi:hypothetical protein